MKDYYVVEPCASAKAYEIKFKGKRIDLKAAEKVGEVVAVTPAVIISKFEKVALSIYASGRIMVKGVEGKDAEKLAEKLVAALEKAGALND